jgi:hypothetical protein
MYEGHPKAPYKPPVKVITLEDIMEVLTKMAQQQTELDAKIDALISDENSLVSAFNTLATEYTTVSNDIKNMLIEIQNNKSIDLSQEIAKLQAADTTLQTLQKAVAAVTAEEEADDQKVNPSGPSDFGQTPK